MPNVLTHSRSKCQRSERVGITEARYPVKKNNTVIAYRGIIQNLGEKLEKIKLRKKIDALSKIIISHTHSVGVK